MRFDAFSRWHLLGALATCVSVLGHSRLVAPAEASPFQKQLVEAVQVEEGPQEAELEAADGETKVVKGPLDDCADSMKKLIQFEWENGVMKPNVATERGEVQQIIYEIRNSAGGGGMSSSSSGNGSWQYQFYGQRMTGTFHHKWPPGDQAKPLEFKIVEMDEPYRELTIQSTTEGQLSIHLTGGNDPWVLRVKQNDDGTFVAQLVDGVEVFSAAERSFAEFCRHHVEFTYERLLPLLRRVGIDPPRTPHDTQVQEVVLSRLRGLDGDQLAEFRELIAGFESSSFEERQATSAAVTRRFEEFTEIMEWAVDEESFSPEARTRLLEIVKEKSDPERVKTLALMRTMNLLADQEYLCWLLSRSEDEENQQLLASQLESITGESLGTDVAAWQQLIGTEPIEAPVVVETEVDTAALTGDGQLKVMADATRRLVRLARVEDTLRLDREWWAEPFGGKTLSELSEEIRAEVRARGLPESFWNGIDEKRTPHLNYAHVLVERFYQELQTKSVRTFGGHSSSGSAHSPNRQFTQNGISCTFSTMPGGPHNFHRHMHNNEEKKPLFKLHLMETLAPFRSLNVEQNEEQRLKLAFTCDQSDVIVRLVELPENEGWVVQDLRGQKVFAEQAETFADLYSSHQEYFDDTFFPLLETFGVIPPGE